LKTLKVLAAVLVTLILALLVGPLGLMLAVNATVLSPSFVTREIDKIDPVSVTENYLNEVTLSQGQLYQDAVLTTLSQNRDWMKTQIRQGIMDSYDYLLGKTNDWSFQIETKAITDDLFDNLKTAYEKSPPADYALLNSTQRQQYITDLRSQFTSEVPSPIEITQADIPASALRNIEQTRIIIHQVQMAYYYTIAICVLMIVCLFLLFQQIKIPARILGILFIIEGFIGTLAFIVVRSLVPGMVSSADLPPSLVISGLPGNGQSANPPLLLQGFVSNVIKDIMLPWGIFVISLLIIGIGLLLVSFLVNKNKRV
jgi:hypothetical protein